MRYHHSSWSDVDRALEAFRYARRSLLVVIALALPFAAWEAAGTTHAVVQEDTVEVHGAEHASTAKHLHVVKHLFMGGSACEAVPAPTASPPAVART